MSENIFLDKFKDKSNSELEYIIENRKNYNKSAVLASIQLLKERNPESNKIVEKVEEEISFEAKKAIATQKKESVKIKKFNPITEDPEAPELHSKKVIMLFSGIFSTIFGAVLMMYNMKATHNQKGRIQVLIFGILYTILTIIIVDTFKVRSPFPIALNLCGAAILNEYFWNKFIGKEKKHRKRSWVRPLFISILITLLFISAYIISNEIS